MSFSYATGKRKTAIAKVWITSGSGKIEVNKVSLDAWLGGLEGAKQKVRKPLNVTKQISLVDIKAVTKGGGILAQSDALCHGISKALCVYDNNLRKALKPEKLLTRDSRSVERKKPGRKKARKSEQFSKR